MPSPEITEAWKACKKALNTKCYLDLAIALAKHLDIAARLGKSGIRPHSTKLIKQESIIKAVQKEFGVKNFQLICNEVMRTLPVLKTVSRLHIANNRLVERS